MTWRLNDIEAAALERRALRQLYKDAQDIIALNPGITDRRIVLMLQWRGYSVAELTRLADLECIHAF